MLRLVQERFEVPPEAASLEREALVIHQRTATTRNQNLLILVHGLGGDRYQYWLALARFLYEDFPHIDLGLYYYDTGLRRTGLWRSLELEEEAEVLADVLRDLRSYEAILLLGHSMGGVLTRGAVARLLETDQKKVLKRIVAMLLFAVPQLGSLRVPPLLRWLSPDARALLPHNRYLKRVARSLTSRIKGAATRDPTRPCNIHVSAVVAAGDFWVDELSATVGIPDNQVKVVRGNHGTVIRPRQREDDSYQFIRNRIDSAVQATTRQGRQKVDLKCSDAVAGDIEGVHDLAVHLFGDDVSPVDAIAGMLALRPGVVRVVHKVVETPIERRERLVGYYCVIPLTADAAALIRAGKLRGSQITAQHMPPPEGPAAALYLGAIAARDFYSRALVLEVLRSDLETALRAGTKELLARAVTEDGLRLVRDYGFTAVTQNTGVGGLFTASNEPVRLHRSRRT